MQSHGVGGLLACSARIALAVVALSSLLGCERTPPAEVTPRTVAKGPVVQPALEAHTAEFERRVYTVTDGVSQAVGFGLANSIMVEGDACVFIVDVMASIESARAVKAEFDKITSKPIKALIYTHNHPDHVFGGPGFVPDGAVDVYAHETTRGQIERVVSVIRPIIERRSDRMFGTFLPHDGPDRIVNSGIGPFLEAAHGGGTPGVIWPNHTLRDALDAEICGVRVQMVHAPGETDDQIFVWLPDKRVLLPGDNVYKAFPNLYTIRGTAYRDVAGWVRSLDRMRALRPEHLAPSHTRPVSGADEIMEILTAYRDAIQFVHDQTIHGMNEGLTADELVERVKLPSHLGDHPYLQEFYGTVAWSVRSIFTGYLGWFDGDAATLSPAPPEERSRGYIELAGGAGNVLAAARRAIDTGRYAWAAELTTHVLRVQPEASEAKALKAQALRALGQRSISPNGRNFYLTQALELEGAVKVRESVPDPKVADFVRSFPIASVLASMPVHLDPDKSADVDTVMAFSFPDCGEQYSLHVRRGIAEFQQGRPPHADLEIRADSKTWIEVVIGLRSLPAAMATGAVEVEGGFTKIPAVLRFLSMFRS